MPIIGTVIDARLRISLAIFPVKSLERHREPSFVSLHICCFFVLQIASLRLGVLYVHNALMYMTPCMDQSEGERDREGSCESERETVRERETEIDRRRQRDRQ